jgi:hypothetical protein
LRSHRTFYRPQKAQANAQHSLEKRQTTAVCFVLVDFAGLVEGYQNRYVVTACEFALCERVASVRRL